MQNILYYSLNFSSFFVFFKLNNKLNNNTIFFYSEVTQLFKTKVTKKFEYPEIGSL
jgi:hypothetical protein